MDKADQGPVDWWRFKDVVSREGGLLAAQRRDRHLPWHVRSNLPAAGVGAQTERSCAIPFGPPRLILAEYHT